MKQARFVGNCRHCRLTELSAAEKLRPLCGSVNIMTGRDFDGRMFFKFHFPASLILLDQWDETICWLMTKLPAAAAGQRSISKSPFKVLFFSFAALSPVSFAQRKVPSGTRFEQSHYKRAKSCSGSSALSDPNGHYEHRASGPADASRLSLTFRSESSKNNENHEKTKKTIISQKIICPISSSLGVRLQWIEKESWTREPKKNT